MKILITGATGFIGRRLTKRLLARGHTVLALTRNPVQAARSLPGVDFHAWEPGKPVSTDLVREADAIVNLAGETVNGRWTRGKKDRIMASRVEGTRSLVDAINASGTPKVLVNASAVGIYGDRGDRRLTEDALPGGGFLSEVVQAWEAEARRAELSNSRVVMLRFGIVLAPEGGALQKLLPLVKLGINGRIGSGRQYWPWVHIEDVIAVIQEALTQPMSGVYNVTAPEPVRQKEFASTLGKVLHRPAVLPTPAFAIRLVQGEFADELLFSKCAVPLALLDHGYKFVYQDIEGALRHLVSKEARVENVPART